MDLGNQNTELSPKFLLNRLNVARNEINNLRQEIKSLRYILEKDVQSIKSILQARQDNPQINGQGLISSENIKPGTSTDNDLIKLKPIGIISTWFPNKRGTPRQPGICQKAPGKITLYNSVFTNPAHALEGLQGFSHMWILFYFHKNDSTHTRAKIAPPRLNGIRTGVFSTRSPHRPCPIGLSLVKIVKVENNLIYFEGVDMVDQSPVLDIKPYIPMYDNPAHIEVINSSQMLLTMDNPTEFDYTEEINDLNISGNESSDLSNPVPEPRGDTINVSVESHCPYNSSENMLDLDVSRDEELALRLQTEEFEGNAALVGNGTTRNITQSPETLRNFQSNPQLRIIGQVSHLNRTASNADSFTDYDRSDSPNLETRGENTRAIHERLQNTHLSDRNEMYDPPLRSNETDYPQNHASRNSRLLDGADGPSTVCGTDLDIIQRRSLHTRIDNSPVRMGVREAPDGEEGFQSQGLNSSQTVDVQLTGATSNSNIAASINTHSMSDAEIRAVNTLRAENNFSDVRVPDWIARPSRDTLSVVFNERALVQLHEILNDKADEQKHAIENILREDPRSVYLRQRWGNQFYTFLIHDLHITCRFDDNRGVVTVFQVRHAGRTCECGQPEWQCLGHTPSS